jgi:serine/threonine protein kinase
VHRDLKPSNVLLAKDGPRVIDFGISRAAESTALTQVLRDNVSKVMVKLAKGRRNSAIILPTCCVSCP